MSAELEAVRRRIDEIRARNPGGVLAVDGSPLRSDALVRFEVASGAGSDAVDVRIAGGMMASAEPATGGAEWAVVVDDWALVVPDREVRPLSSVRDCAVRIGDERKPLPTHFELARCTPEYFDRPIPNALLSVFHEAHGTPVGSVHFSILFEDGVPGHSGDDPEIREEIPRAAVGYSWPLYWEYRHHRAPQQRLFLGAFIHADWRDMFNLQGLNDQGQFYENVAAYGELPQDLLVYCQILAASARLHPESG